jgi:hypothetical protein
MKRKYFEAFGDLEEEIRFLRKLLFSLAAALSLFSLILILLSKRAPLVIRVDQVKGAQVIEDLRLNNEPAPYEMIAFGKRFAARYTGYNSYTVARDLTEAMNQMSSSFQKEAKKKILDSGLISKIAEARIHTELEFKEERLERDSKEVALVSLVGVRRISRYGDERVHEEHLFRADLVLKKTPRSKDVPEGLLVDEYREIVLNDLTERKEKT